MNTLVRFGILSAALFTVQFQHRLSADEAVVIRSSESESGVASEAGLGKFRQKSNTGSATLPAAGGAAATPSTQTQIPAVDGSENTPAEIRAACFERMAALGIAAAAGTGEDKKKQGAGSGAVKPRRIMNLVELIDRISRSEQLGRLVDLASTGTSPLEIVRLAAGIARIGLMSESGVSGDVTLEVAGAESEADAQAFVEALKSLHAADQASGQVTTEYVDAKAKLEAAQKTQLENLEKKFDAKRDAEMLRHKIQSTERTLNELRRSLQEADAAARR